MMVEPGLLGHFKGLWVGGAEPITVTGLLWFISEFFEGKVFFVFFLIAAYEGFHIGEKAEYYFFFYRIKWLLLVP